MLSEQRLIRMEERFGGVHHRRPRKESPLHPISVTSMRGGDRMTVHPYARHYVEHLPAAPRTIVELGILAGTGLAMWCDLYPNARVIGLDIDLSHYVENLSELLQRGAFARNKPDIAVFDKMLDNTERYEELLDDTKIDIFIDDSLHSSNSILHAFHNVEPFLSEDFVYFAEDNDTVHEYFSKDTSYEVISKDRLTIVKP